MEKTILGLRAETSIHAGTGQNTGVVDLPIQRESHTGWPCVYGSAMKGALRSHAEMRCGNPTWIKDVFGPSPDANKASEHAGAIAVTDARLLLLPVRSLTGHFKWTTCPAVLERLKRDMQMVGIPIEFNIPPATVGAVVTSCGGTQIFLEEYQFNQVQENIDDLIAVLVGFGMDMENLRQQLAIMNNEDFADFCRTATAVTPHIAIDNTKNKKTVIPGALWYEETLPPDTLLYTMLLANPSRNINGGMNPETVLGCVTGMFTNDNHYLQIGGNETVGMGWCRVTEVSL
jgi:CRISPR-associated protein Cmr4